MSTNTKKRFHVVRIYSDGYSLMGSFADRSEARDMVLRDPLRTGGCVLRDGNTGKRYSVAELRAALPA
jgi:hypothetical protein